MAEAGIPTQADAEVYLLKDGQQDGEKDRQHDKHKDKQQELQDKKRDWRKKRITPDHFVSLQVTNQEVSWTRNIE